MRTHTDTYFCTNTHRLKHTLSQHQQAEGGGSPFCSADGTCPLKGSKGQGPECKGRALVAVVTSFSGGTFPPVVRLLNPTADALSLVKLHFENVSLLLNAMRILNARPPRACFTGSFCSQPPQSWLKMFYKRIKVF